MGTAHEVIINQKVFLYKDKAPFVTSGHSTMGALEYDSATDSLKCHECGEWFRHVGAHAYSAHGLTSRQYKSAHGLRMKTPLIGPNVRRRLRISGLKCVKQALSAGRRTRFVARTGSGLLRRKSGTQYEARNERGSCEAQVIESLRRLAKYHGRTPTIDEMRDSGVNTQSSEKLFGKKMYEILLMIGLEPRAPGERTFEQQAIRAVVAPAVDASDRQFPRFSGIEPGPSPTRSLVVDGVWQVPPEQRPKGWERMAAREPGITQRKHSPSDV